jgi:outer membrane protein TolC
MSRHLNTILLCTLLSGCASYRALPLDDSAPRPDLLAHLTVDAASMPFPILPAHRFDPSDGLDMTEVAMLAVANNPDLKVGRGDVSIARAQAFAAGLLPDPQLALSGDLSNTGTTRAVSLGLSYDVSALLLRSSAHAAAQGEARKADLTLLWQEWQVVSQARLLFIKQVQAQKQGAVLEVTARLFADRLQRTRTALARGLLSSDAIVPHLTALQDVQRQVFDLKKQVNQNTHDLNALLGLAPDTVLHLQDSPDLDPVDKPAVLTYLTDLTRRRPDLLALKAGVEAEDQRYRGALLAQFPALNVGLTRARDSSGIASNSVGVSISLPFLNRNRGNIAIEQATRQKLADEYHQRLNAARSDILRIVDERQLAIAQLAQVDSEVAELSATLAHSDLAFRAGNLDALAYASARAALLARQVDQITLQQSIRELHVALQTLLGPDSSTERKAP